MAETAPWEDYGAETGPWADYGAPPATAASLTASNPAEYDPNSAAFQQRYGATAGNTFGQNVAAGAGKSVTDMYLGLRQMLGLEPGSAAAEKRALDAPLMATTGGRVGQVAGTIAAGAPLALMPGANLAAGSALGGAAMGALQPAEGMGERYRNLALGGGLGYLGGAIGNALTTRLAPNVPANFVAPATSSSALTGAQERAAEAGRGLGMRLTPGEQSGSTGLRQLEAKLESWPWTSGPMARLKEGNQAALNRAWAKNIGEGGASVDSEVLGSASDRLGSVFESVRNPSRIVSASPQTSTATLHAIDQDFAGLLPGNASIRSNPLVSQFETLMGSGSANAEQLGQLSSKLGKAAYKQMSGPAGDRDLGQALYAVKDHVDDLVQSTLSGSESSAYAAARQQYRALMQLTARVGNVNPSTGNVGGGSLANYLQTKDRPGFLFGKNQSEAYNAVRFAQAFKPIVGNSGTATRSVGVSDLLMAPIGVPANLMTRAYLSAPGSAAVRGMAATPKLIGRGVDTAAEAIAPYAQMGLPGMSGALVPYLTK